MKKFIITVLGLLIFFGVFAQEIPQKISYQGKLLENGNQKKITQQESNFEDDYKQFLENQKIPFLKANGEVFVLNGTAWERSYGEKDYVLTPVFADEAAILEYNTRIKEKDDPQNEIYKSNFHFLKIEITSLSKSLLLNMNINVPYYIHDNVNAYLPQIDIDILSVNGVNFKYLESYGKNKVQIAENKGSKATIWSEGWETSYVPSSAYPADATCSKDVYWGDVSCCPHNGSWSIWCAANGTNIQSQYMCSSCTTGEYYNNMCAYVSKYNDISISCYTGIAFNFYIRYDTYSNDVVKRYYTINGASWVLSPNQYSGNSGGWLYKTYSITGSGIYSYSWKFEFISNVLSSNKTGVYLDDLSVTGTPTTPPPNNTGNWSNCSNNYRSRPVTTYTWSANSPCYTSNTTTQYECCGSAPATTYGSWTNCSNNSRSRQVTTYTVNSPGSYPNCITSNTTTQYECCGTLPNTLYGPWSACNDCSQSHQVTTYSWGTYPNCVIPNTTTQTQACNNPPPPSAWSSCNNNIKSRSVYTCTGNGTYSTTTEYQCCGTLPNTLHGPWSAWNNCSRSRQVTTYSWGVYPNCVIPNTTTEYQTGDNPTSTTSATPDSGSCNGTATVNVNGGTFPYTYQWSNGCTTFNCTGLCTGTYNVTVTDNHGCDNLNSVFVDDVSGINELDFISNLNIYPNPNTGEFVIEMEITQPENLEIKLFNVIGQIIYEEHLDKFFGVYKKTINLSKNAKGVYNLQLISTQGIISKKIVIE